MGVGADVARPGETTQEATELPKRDGGHSHVCGGDVRPGMNPGGPWLRGHWCLHQDGGTLRERAGVGRRCRALSLLDTSHPRGGGLYGAQNRGLSRPKSGSRNTWR